MLVEVLEATLGEDRQAWRKLGTRLPSQARSVQSFLSDMEVGGAEDWSEAGAQAVFEQFTDVGFLWSPSPRRPVEPGIPSLAGDAGGGAPGVGEGDAPGPSGAWLRGPRLGNGGRRRGRV